MQRSGSKRRLRNVTIRVQRPPGKATGGKTSVLSEVKASRMDTSVALDDVTGTPVFHEKRRYTVARDRQYPRAGIRDDGLFGGSRWGSPMFGGGKLAGGTVVHGSQAAPNMQVYDTETGETLRIGGRTEDTRRRHSVIHVERDG